MIESNKNSVIALVVWRLSLLILVPIMLFIILATRPILKRHYQPKCITKWYNKTDLKWFS